MPLEDLKFTLRKAKFTTFTPATLELQNDALTTEDLDSNPIETNNTNLTLSLTVYRITLKF